MVGSNISCALIAGGTQHGLPGIVRRLFYLGTTMRVGFGLCHKKVRTAGSDTDEVVEKKTVFAD